jgi:hypothetical protein
MRWSLRLPGGAVEIVRYSIMMTAESIEMKRSDFGFRANGSWTMRVTPVYRATAFAACTVLAAAMLHVPLATAAQPKTTAEPVGPSLCPETISVEQKVSDLPQGWEAGTSGAKTQIAMVTFFDGPPAERASLKYDNELKQRGNWVATWILAPTGRGHWIQCAYENTTAVLSKRLPDAVKTCSVTYERNNKAANALPLVKHVGCSETLPKKPDDKKSDDVKK